MSIHEYFIYMKEVNDKIYFFREKLQHLKKNIQKADPKLTAESKAVQTAQNQNR